jgi:hypothetical protein
MPAREGYAYCLWRVVPDLARGECLNAGLVLLCRRRSFLEARIHLDERKLGALAPELDPAPVRAHLEALALVAAGDPAGGAVARQELSERFHWLAAPSSTIVQPGVVHTGLSADPRAELDRLYAALVA